MSRKARWIRVPREPGLIASDRQDVLRARHSSGDDGSCCYELSRITLTRDDVAWLLEDHSASSCGSRLRLTNVDLCGLDLSDLVFEDAWMRDAKIARANLQRAVFRRADLTGAWLTDAECEDAVFTEAILERAHLEGAGLMGADLRRARLAFAHLDGARLPNADLEGADLLEARLPDAYLGAANLTRANMMGAHLERSSFMWGQLKDAQLAGSFLDLAVLRRAHLQSANLAGAILDDVDLTEAHLEGANMAGARLLGTNLTRAILDGETNLQHIVVGTGARGLTLADVRGDEVNLSVFDWAPIRRLADESRARAADKGEGPMSPAAAYAAAARASQQVSLQLQQRGMITEAERFAFRARVMQRLELRRIGLKAAPRYLFSLALALLAGYGYRPSRGFLAYLLVIAAFSVGYYFAGVHNMMEAAVVSITAFHGRGFFPNQFSPGDPLAIVASFEAVIGLIIELVFIATISQRLFGK
jgi:uncharacterized protein YjbI with pentapeptide repeats